MIAQIFFIDFFLGYEFQTYGLDVLNYSEMEPEERGDPMHVVFPKVGIRYILFSTKKVFMVAYTVVSLLVIQMIQIFMQYFILFVVLAQKNYFTFISILFCINFLYLFKMLLRIF